MPCYHPLRGYRAKSGSGITFTISKGYSDQPLSIPCGQCIGCKLEKSRQWAIRCVHENAMHEQSAFLTLTYAPERLPPHGTLVKKHVQDFLKRYRRWLNGKKIRYAYCGEYGEQKNRPHYHALIFGHDFNDKKELTKIGGHQLYTSLKLDELWTHGNCSIGNITFESAAYVARYVTKKITGKNATSHYGELINTETGELTPRRIPEFFETSRRPGIGKPWLDKFKKEVYPLDEVLMRGKLMKPPKYYDQLHKKVDEEGFAKTQRQRIAASKNNPDNNFERRLVLEEIKQIESTKLKRNYEK